MKVMGFHPAEEPHPPSLDFLGVSGVTTFMTRDPPGAAAWGLPEAGLSTGLERNGNGDGFFLCWLTGLHVQIAGVHEAGSRAPGGPACRDQLPAEGECSSPRRSRPDRQCQPVR